MYFEEELTNVNIAKELGISPLYVTKILKRHPDYEFKKERRSKIRYKEYLTRKKEKRKLKEKEKGKDDNAIEYLRHLQYQNSIEMSKRYLA